MGTTETSRVCYSIKFGFLDKETEPARINVTVVVDMSAVLG